MTAHHSKFCEACWRDQVHMEHAVQRCSSPTDGQDHACSDDPVAQCISLCTWLHLQRRAAPHFPGDVPLHRLGLPRGAAAAAIAAERSSLPQPPDAGTATCCRRYLGRPGTASDCRRSASCECVVPPSPRHHLVFPEGTGPCQEDDPLLRNLAQCFKHSRGSVLSLCL